MLATTIWPVERPAAKSSGRDAEGDHAMLETFWDSRSLLTPLRDGLRVFGRCALVRESCFSGERDKKPSEAPHGVALGEEKRDKVADSRRCFPASENKPLAGAVWSGIRSWGWIPPRRGCYRCAGLLRRLVHPDVCPMTVAPSPSRRGPLRTR